MKSLAGNRANPVVVKCLWAMFAVVACLLFTTAASPVEAKAEPALYAVVVGVREFEHPEGIDPLTVSDKDAKDFCSFLKDMEGLFSGTHITLLLNKEATKENIVAALRKKLACARKDDVVIIYLSGHGVAHPTNPNEYYFVTYDTKADHLYATGLMINDRRLFSSVKSDRVLLLADACHSGGFLPGIEKGLKPKSPEKYFSVFRDIAGRIAISSSKPGEISFEKRQFGNSVFTHFLIKGMRGEADRLAAKGAGDGKITVGELYDYVSEWTRETTRGRQNPQLYCVRGDLDDALVRIPTYDKPLKIKVQFLYEGSDGSIKPLTDSSVLKSGQKLGIAFRPETDCYVNIFWWDRTGCVWRMYPNPTYGEGSGVAKAGQTCWLPSKVGQKHWYVLNRTPGMETIYFMASRKPNPKIDALYDKLKELGSEAKSGGKGSAVAGELERLLNLMGPANYTVPMDAKASSPSREALFERMENEINVAGADAVFKVSFKHE